MKKKSSEQSSQSQPQLPPKKKVVRRRRASAPRRVPLLTVTEHTAQKHLLIRHKEKLKGVSEHFP